MPLLRLKLSDLQTLSAPSALSLGSEVGPDDTGDLVARIRHQFRFLPDPIPVEGEEVLVEFPEETPCSRSDVTRLAEKAGKRARGGQYGKALDVFQWVLKIQSSLHRARRDLDVIFSETGDIDRTANHLIGVLRVDPSVALNRGSLDNVFRSNRKRQGDRTWMGACTEAEHVRPALISALFVSAAVGDRVQPK